MRTVAGPRMALVLCLLGGQVASQNSAIATQTKAEEELSRSVRHQVLMLPYYSVFDYVTFAIDGSKVTLNGQVVRPTLKENAEVAVKNIEGVAIVTNAIEVLPKSTADDALRRQLYRVIYEDEELKQYGAQAVPSIHIIVKNGAVALEGAVHSKSDSELAEKKAASIPGMHNLANHLVVREKEITAK